MSTAAALPAPYASTPPGRPDPSTAADELAVRRVLHSMLRAIGAADDAAIERLWQPDARFHGARGTIVGRDAIRAEFVRRRATQPPIRDICANAIVEIAGDRARATHVNLGLVADRAPPAVYITSVVESSLTRDAAGDWRIADWHLAVDPSFDAAVGTSHDVLARHAARIEALEARIAALEPAGTHRSTTDVR